MLILVSSCVEHFSLYNGMHGVASCMCAFGSALLVLQMLHACSIYHPALIPFHTCSIHLSYGIISRRYTSYMIYICVCMCARAMGCLAGASGFMGTCCWPWGPCLWALVALPCTGPWHMGGSGRRSTWVSLFPRRAKEVSSKGRDNYHKHSD